jgi:DNA-binding MarR family transcriptional regulator
MGNDRKPSRAASLEFAAGEEVREPAQMKNYLGYAIRRAQMRAYESFYNALRDLETTPSRFTLMLLMRENPGIRSVDLARKLGVARSGMVRLIDDLEGRGLIVREVVKADRRNQALALTTEGRRYLRQLERAVGRHESALTDKLTAKERAQLIKLLWRVGT